MNILALDTSTDTASVAVLQDDTILHEESFNYDKRHSQMLVPMIEHALQWVNMSVKNIDLWAVDIGPGSFTGLRIGCAVIKALSHVTDKPIAGIISLDALAADVSLTCYPVYPLIDAQQQNVYTARYIWQGYHMFRESEYMVLPISEFKTIALKEAAIVFTGPASIVYRYDLQNDLGSRAIFASNYHCMPKASIIGALGLDKVRSGEVKDYVSLLPFYMRKSQAEVKAGA